MHRIVIAHVIQEHGETDIWHSIPRTGQRILFSPNNSAVA